MSTGLIESSVPSDQDPTPVIFTCTTDFGVNFSFGMLGCISTIFFAYRRCFYRLLKLSVIHDAFIFCQAILNIINHAHRHEGLTGSEATRKSLTQWCEVWPRYGEYPDRCGTVSGKQNYFLLVDHWKVPDDKAAPLSMSRLYSLPRSNQFLSILPETRRAAYLFNWCLQALPMSIWQAQVTTGSTDVWNSLGGWPRSFAHFLMPFRVTSMWREEPIPFGNHTNTSERFQHYLMFWTLFSLG